MISTGVRSRQPQREPWTHERLVHERSLALGQAVDTSTWKTYGSALNSYIEFCRIHNFPIDPSTDSLSFFIVFLAGNGIKPTSIDSYLSGICQQLEPYFPDVRSIRKSTLVARTLKGCRRRFGTPTNRKRALTVDNLLRVITHFTASILHDDKLFVAQIVTGFSALLRLGELTAPDDDALHDPRKVVKRLSVKISPGQYQFFLPSHKADKFFEGNTIIVKKFPRADFDPNTHFLEYLASRDALFPFSSPLWLTAGGSVPKRAMFIRRLRMFFDDSVGGQSMRAGGATFMAECGFAPSLIQASGRWASQTFQIYIRKNPVLIQAMLFGRRQDELGLRIG